MQTQRFDVVPGVVLVGSVTFLSWAAATWLSRPGAAFPVSPLSLGVLFGLLVANLWPPTPGFTPGIRFVSRKVLRVAIVLMGLRLSLGQILSVGPRAVVVVLLGSGVTFVFTLALGRWLKLPTQRALLLASGTSVCGAAAIAAVDGCIQAKEEDVGFALAAVTLFGTLALGVYPLAMALLRLPSRFYALWVGASIHEVAQVAAAASILPSADQALASTVKLLRVLLILPITLGLSWLPSRSKAPGHRSVSVPWFAVAFFGVCVVFSFPILSAGTTRFLLDIDTVLLTSAMVALGLEIRLSRFRSMELKSLWLGLLPTLVLSATSILLCWVEASL